MHKLTWRSILVESALADLGEDDLHGIDPDLWVHGEELEDADSVLEELAAQKPIDDPNFSNDVRQVEHLAQVEGQAPDGVAVEIGHQVVGQDLLLAITTGRIAQVEHVQTLDDAAHFGPFPNLISKFKIKNQKSKIQNQK